MTRPKTPGVYTEEISTFPPSVAEVATAVPAFIGYTAKAKRGQEDLKLKPTKIYSFKEFEDLFGQPEVEKIEVKVEAGNASAGVTTSPKATHVLSWAMRMYFDNGGGQCYIVSVGTYGAIKKEELLAGLNAVAMEDEPTLLVVPEAAMDKDAYNDVVKKMLEQCGKLGDRFAILDVRTDEVAELPDKWDTVRDTFGAVVAASGSSGLSYGAAYYPFLRSSLNVELGDETKVEVTYTDSAGDEKTGKLNDLRDSQTAVYSVVKKELARQYVVMPPSAAVAGVYAAVDRARGVWKAPANVSLAGVIEPMVRVTDDVQGGLNVDPDTGKSINALRAFAGKGTLVWGARTLAGNDNEWRYISVRRFFNMVEESVKKSTAWAVFESNDANTWVKVRGMIESYLIDKWREGALAGATPKDAFFVRCGLGTTMTVQDVLQGLMNVEIGMAVVRPAEFIVLKFSHKLQTS